MDGQSLDRFPRKTITETELYQYFQCVSYETLLVCVRKLRSDGYLIPVKQSGQNGRTPALFNKYRIHLPEKNLDHIKKSIQMLHPSLNMTGYLQDTERFEIHKSLIEPISDALWQKSDWLTSRMSINEKSLLLYMDEKRIVAERKKFEAVLGFNHISYAFFQCYDTPEPYFSWNLSRNESKNENAFQTDNPESQNRGVLVLENKDIWYTLADLAREMQRTNLFHEHIGCLVYGEGNKVCRTQASLTAYLEQILPHPLPPVWYAGDIDDEGVRIWERMRAENPKLQISLHRPIYQLLYSWAVTYEKSAFNDLTDTHDARTANRLTRAQWLSFLKDSGAHAVLTADQQENLAGALVCGKRIPQEAANHIRLKELLLTVPQTTREGGDR